VLTIGLAVYVHTHGFAWLLCLELTLNKIQLQALRRTSQCVQQITGIHIVLTRANPDDHGSRKRNQALFPAQDLAVVYKAPTSEHIATRLA
jgi:hypothetical protein